MDSKEALVDKGEKNCVIAAFCWEWTTGGDPAFIWVNLDSRGEK